MAGSWVLKVGADLIKCFTLPLTRPGGVVQLGSLLAPRERIERVAVRVMCEAGDILNKLLLE